jgi:hypothetical protein
MTLPLINDYKTAMANAKARFATLKVSPVLDPRRHPQFLAGNFACVFKAINETGATLAIKCFTRDMPDLEKRYLTLSRFIRTAHPASMVDLQYLPDELYTTSSVASSGDYPVVVMPWLDGSTIGEATETLCRRNNRRGLAALTRAWAKLCYDLLNRGIAHGDLKHDNVIITRESKLKLIDYDSMYIDELKGLASPLVGGINFQHPLRNPGHFDSTVDHVSILVMLLSLRALTFEPSLLEVYNNGENIILTRDDFIAAERSELMSTLLKIPDFFVQDWTRQLIKGCQSKSIRIPNIKNIVMSAMKLDASPQEAGAKRLFSFLSVALPSLNLGR